MEDTLNIIYSLFMFIIGTLFGSFFSLATYRIPRKQDIVYTRSYCPKCKHKLGFFDCLPILSFISTIGRCKYCKCYISLRYVILELVSGFVFLVSYIIFGFSIKLIIFLACYIYLVIYIGSEIMKKKMTADEIKVVEKITEEKKNNKTKKNNKKAGVLNIEILIAVIVFVFFFISAIGVTINYKNVLTEYKTKSYALNICLNEINKAAATEFNLLETTSGIEIIDNVEYKYERNVSFLNEEATVKDVLVKITYNIGVKEQTIELKKIIGGV